MGKIKFREIDLFDFTSFFWHGLFLILWPTAENKYILYYITLINFCSLFLYSSDEEDHDGWGNEVPLEPLEQLARLDMSPSRFSMSSISIASTRSFLGSDLEGPGTPPSPEGLNVTFFSDDSDR